MAGATDLQLQLKDGTNTFTFDYDGELQFDQEHQFNESNQPPELKQIVERWTVTGARIVGSSHEDAWDKLNLFLASVEDRTSSPLTHATLVRDPSGTPFIERTLGSTSGEGFRLEELDIGDETVPDLQSAQFRTVFTVNFTIAHFKVFADGNGISTWEQSIRRAYGPDGLEQLEWETSISVAEGAVTTALDLAKIYAVIPIAALGNTYTWDTNSDEGFDWEEVNPDTRVSKAPTKLRIVSRVRQQGISVGTPTAGNSVGDVELMVTEQKTANLTRTITEARAVGPGALAWVRNQDPGGDQKESTVVEDQAKRRAEGRWVVDDSSDSAEPRVEVSARVTGGHRDFTYVAVTNGEPPQEVIGPLQPWRAEVLITITQFGPQPSNEQMMFPPELFSPWQLNRNLSREDSIPMLVSAGKDENQAEWKREAQLVYIAQGGEGNEPSVFSLLDLYGQPSVSSYFFAP